MPLYRCTLIDEAVKAEMSEWRKGSVEVEAARQRAWSENWISRQKKPAPADFVPCDATIRVEKLD